MLLRNYAGFHNGTFRYWYRIFLVRYFLQYTSDEESIKFATKELLQMGIINKDEDVEDYYREKIYHETK